MVCEIVSAIRFTRALVHMLGYSLHMPAITCGDYPVNWSNTQVSLSLLSWTDGLSIQVQYRENTVVVLEMVDIDMFRLYTGGQ